MKDIDVNLPDCLKQLNPKLVLYLNSDADTVKNWIKRLKKHKPHHYRDWRASVKSNIYNEGRIEVVAIRPRKDTTCNDHMFFDQAPLTDSVKKDHGIRII